MKEYRIFVSSLQKEMGKERRSVKEYIEDDPFISKYFEVFVFEKDAPARDKTARQKYLAQIDKSDIYIGILGSQYGEPGKDGLSPVEREFQRATDKGLERIIYIHGKKDLDKEKRMREFIRSISKNLIRKRYENISDLLKNIHESLFDFLQDQGNITFEPFDSLSPQCSTYKDINEDLVKDFLKNRAKKLKVDIPEISIKDFLLKTLKVVKEKEEILKPTNAALLFFCEYPQKYIDQSRIKVARFRGNTRIESLDSQEITGNIYRMLQEVEKFIKRNTRLAGKIVEFKRVDIPEYPYEAIREAVINAIAHRNYSRKGANVQIDIFDDRIEITNPGKLLPGLDINNLEGVHETRNKVICRIFHETKDMEKFGTGVRKMNRLMIEHGLKPPTFSQPGNFFRATFYGPGDKILDLVSSIPKERQTDLEEEGLNRRQIEALRIMVNEGDSMTNRKYRELFGVTNKTAAEDLKQLVKKGMAKSRGRGRSVSYIAR